MAKNPLPSSMDHLDDEEYIDIEVSSYYYFSSSSPQNKEFEFQIANYNKENTISPADELFYRGNLLPLHQKIFQEEDLEDSFCISQDIKVSKKKTSNRTTRWHSSTKCLSSTSTNSSTNGGAFSTSSNSSFNSNNTFTSEIVEDSIKAAIAHCKKSQLCGWA
ncbi:hypothetical protein H5410_053241 [Solanum commersonii]|uniref:Uncharacterized protein n=1 Tax=Solanum commersonii TaxID=4109 RepID=A0A9J5X5V3_SOLCO|nr:hypothetical protein H5410_053241 [Solanum commersonii]